MWRVKKENEYEYVVTAENDVLPPPETVIYSLFGPFVFCNSATPAEGYSLQLFFSFRGYITILTDNSSFIYLTRGNKFKELYRNFSLPKAILM